MPFVRCSTKSILLDIVILCFLSQVFVVKGDSTEHKTEKLTIGVPNTAFTFKNFVKISSSSNNPDEKNYTGFCIRVFEEVQKKLDYLIPYEFVEFNGPSYDELVANVANKTYSAAVGDITILAKRWENVEFTVPFTESGLSMVVPVKPGPKGWIFLHPFTLGMWLAIVVVLVYTMFIVWFVEHRSNPDFSGSWKDQLGNALWFTFSSLFLAHSKYNIFSSMFLCVCFLLLKMFEPNYIAVFVS
jgi:ionotropic glutamate receptor